MNKILCKLFGHIFTYTTNISYNDGLSSVEKILRTDECRRCGEKKIYNREEFDKLPIMNNHFRVLVHCPDCGSGYINQEYFKNYQCLIDCKCIEEQGRHIMKYHHICKK